MTQRHISGLILCPAFDLWRKLCAASRLHRKSRMYSMCQTSCCMCILHVYLRSVWILLDFRLYLWGSSQQSNITTKFKPVTWLIFRPFANERFDEKGGRAPGRLSELTVEETKQLATLLFVLSQMPKLMHVPVFSQLVKR